MMCMGGGSGNMDPYVPPMSHLSRGVDVQEVVRLKMIEDNTKVTKIKGVAPSLAKSVGRSSLWPSWAIGTIRVLGAVSIVGFILLLWALVDASARISHPDRYVEQSENIGDGGKND